MGFYGNITNTSRTTFQFDRIYSSRYDMEGKTTTDGVFNGRYVLIEYDSNIDSEAYKKPWIIVVPPNGEAKIYFSARAEEHPESNINDDTMFDKARTEDPDFYNYFNGAVKTQALTPRDLADYQLLYLGKGQVYHTLNAESFFVKFKADGTWEQVSPLELISNIDWVNYNVPSDDIEYAVNVAAGINGENLDIRYVLQHDNYVHYLHIANNEFFLTETDVFEEMNPDAVLYGVVLPEHQYFYNEEFEFWQILDETYEEDGSEYRRLMKLPESEDAYTQNFNLDKQYYRTTRGYDSTVWQKVFVDGVEKYVMIAELNTVVPTFGITADPPSLLPLNPHWGADSTNVYYDLHWQPQWGFRIKTAANNLTLPTVSPSGNLFVYNDGETIFQGQYGNSPLRDLSKDARIYPSDVSVTMSQAFEDNQAEAVSQREILYYDYERGVWVNDTSKKVPAAIYFNKDGLDSENIAYSSDLIDDTLPYGRYRRDLVDTLWDDADAISVTPTGLSGNIYNQHNGTYVKKAQVDTQELSIMLPSIGNMMAHIWDKIYGGRNTSPLIQATNKRNKDITWENGGDHLYRLGLRLRGTDGRQYNTDAIETLAGCINTAHDLFGMIIKGYDTEQEILNDLENLNFDRIYYAEDTGKYYRKITSYRYNEIPEADYDYIIVNHATDYLNTEKIHNGEYWILQEGVYINVNDPNNLNYEYDPNETYYYKTIASQYLKVYDPSTDSDSVQFADFPFGEYKWYIDRDISLPNSDTTKANFIKNSNYEEGREYYSVSATPVTLTDSFSPDTYFYRNRTDGNFYLERSTVPIGEHEPYYKIDVSQMNDTLNARNYTGIYIPGKYYYKDPVTGSYRVDNTVDGSMIDAATPGSVPKPCWALAETTIVPDSSDSTIVYKAEYRFDPIDFESPFELREYQPNVYYIPDQNNPGSYTLSLGDYSSVINNGIGYYVRSIEYVKQGEGLEINIDTSVTIYLGSLAIFRPNTYYQKIYDNEQTELVVQLKFLTGEDIMNYGAHLENEAPVYIFGEYTDNANEPPYQPPEGVIIEYPNRGDGIPFMSFEDRMRLDNTWTTWLDNPANAAAYEQEHPDEPRIPMLCQLGNFYYANSYHYMTSEGSYILDKRENASDIQYYLITNATSISSYPKRVIYWQADDYYYLDPQTGAYVQITSWNNSLLNYVIYAKSGVYIYSDTTPNSDDPLPRGMEWNVFAKSIPQNIKLATRTKEYTIKEMPNYAIDTTTINGILLKIYQTLESDYDNRTRDTNIVTGGLNKVSDAVARFYNIRSRQLTIVDDAGRVHSAEVLTNQRDSAAVSKGNDVTKYYDYVGADAYPEASTVANMHKQWITVNIDGNLVAPKVTVHHNFQPVTNTPTYYNINTNNNTQAGLSTHSVGTGSDAYLTDNITLYNPIVDDMGHIVGNQNKTLTLPYGFKQISSNFVGNSITQLTNSNETLIATNTQDAFTLNSHNAWILIDVSNTNKQITLAHSVNQNYINLSDINITETQKTINGTQQSVTVVDNVEFTDYYIDNNDEYHSYVKTIDYTNDSGNNSVNPTLPLELWHYTFDTGGHLVKQSRTKVILPSGFKRISLENDSSVNPTITEIVTNDNTLTANNASDTIVFQAGNRWIQLAGDTTNNILTIAHSAAGTTAIAAGDDRDPDANTLELQVMTPKTFTSVTDPTQTGYDRNKFKVPYLEIDNIGHVSKLTEHYVQIPGFDVSVENHSGSLANTNGTYGQVAVGLTLQQNSVNAEEDSLTLHTVATGDLHISSIGTIQDYDTDFNNDAINHSFSEYSNQVGTLAQNLWKLNSTTVYKTTTQLQYLHTLMFDRTKWLTEISENLNTEIHSLSNRVQACENGESTYTYSVEKEHITLSELVERVSLIEETLKALVTINENTKSLEVLSQDELSDIFEWDTVTVNLIHADTGTVESKSFIIGNTINRNDYLHYMGSASNCTYKDSSDNAIIFPFFAPSSALTIIEVEVVSE